MYRVMRPGDRVSLGIRSLAYVSQCIVNRANIPAFLHRLRGLADQESGFPDPESKAYFFRFYEMLLREHLVEHSSMEDKNGESVNFGRAVDALFVVTMGEDTQMSASLRRAIVHADEKAASRAPQVGCCSLQDFPPRLNTSQRQALLKGLRRTLTLVLGPPGTGKTALGLQFLKAWAHADSNRVAGELVSSLATSSNNCAVDNLFTGLLAMNLPAVRYCSRNALKAVDPIHMGKVVPEMMGPKLVRLRQAYITCSTAVYAKRLDNKDFPSLAMAFPRVELDEACQITEPDAVSPMTMGASQVVLIGDPHQLAPQVENHVAMSLGLDVSMFARLRNRGDIPVFLLNEQYRMHPKIASFPGKYIYNNAVGNGENVSHLRPPEGFHWHNGCPVSFVVSTGLEEKAGNSFVNKREAFVVHELARALFRCGGVKPDQVGVMASYRPQADLIRRFLPEVKTGTVDSFQGSEKDLIFLSLVRSSQLGFVSDDRRLNVALTRARRGLIIVGSRHVLEDSASLWRTWADWMAQEHLQQSESAVLPLGHHQRWKNFRP